MNTHTKKLFDRALDQAVPGTWTTLSHEQITKLSQVFAELIVRECIDKIETHRIQELENNSAAGSKWCDDMTISVFDRKLHSR
jgi:hypothetical protein